MVKKTIREVMFFVLLAVLFHVAVQLAMFWTRHSKINGDVAYILTGLVYTLVMVALFFISNLNKNCSENFWDVSPAAQCRGGSYMFQGDSQVAKDCRAMEHTKEGRCAISAYNCPNGFEGIPRIPFEYTPLSNDQWQNERCESSPVRECSGNSTVSMNQDDPI